MKIFIFFFFFFAQNMNCVYTLEPPHLGGSNEYPQSIFHGQETRDHTASFPFLNWRPPLRLIEQLGDIFMVFLR